jgi:hypothetical protein
MSLEQNTPANRSSSVENQTTIPDKLERTSDSSALVEQPPPTVKGQ